ncbi:FAD-dependent oxidoreductase [candidate division WOR-3 bacterium]|nr:FAD-dependent oxidoreductase [candidate division WOR-3 bacterium]
MLKLKNKFIFAPIKTGYSSEDGVVSERHLAFYGIRSKFLGAVIPEPFYLDKSLREIPTQMGIDSDDKIKGLKRLTDSLHRFDTKVIAHLNHPGRMANPKITGNIFLSSTDKPCENGGFIPKRMDLEDIKNTVKLFVMAAERAKESGFDALELQFGHGYLLAQFISPFVNDRDDEYGGDFENRISFPLMVLEAIKKAVKLPVIVRLSGDEMVPKGIKLTEMVELSKKLAEKDVEAIHVSAGTVCSTPPWFFQHMFVPKGKTWEMAKEIKDGTGSKIIFVGRVDSPEDVDILQNKFSADYIAVGRALVADPDFVGKITGEIKAEIRPCLACVEGCLGGVRSGKGLQCLINPEVGREDETFERAQTQKKYAVVGGGLAGMQSALTLRRRGHKVDLFEKENLGGQFNLAPLTPNKRSMAKLVPYFKKELESNQVNVIKKEAMESDLISKYDGVILATGSVPAVPDIPGLKSYFWADILLEENLPKNKNVLIIGGGLVGVDVATALIPLGNRVTIVKRTTDFGGDMELMAKTLSLKMMKDKGTIFSEYTHIKKIEGRTVFAERNGQQIRFEDIDIIVVSTSMKSYNPLEGKIKGRVPVWTIGDAREVGNAQDAIAEAFDVSSRL